MTKGKAVGLAVAASVAATSLLWIAMLVALSSVAPRSCRWSDVVPPMSVVIRDLVETGDAGRHDDLKRKLGVLSTRWEAFRRGGDEPSLFFGDIVAVGKTASPDGTEPSDGTAAAMPTERDATGDE